MKKFLSVFAICVLAAVLGLTLAGCTNPTKYKEEVEGYGIFKNTTTSAIPQTAFQKIAAEHFNSELPDGKLRKKALILTVDGMRADAFSLIKDYGLGIMRMHEEGGIYLAYAGGEKKSYRTDTAPGTVSLMTGKWADEVNVLKNSDEKGAEPESIFTTIAKKDYSVKLNVGWSTHIETTFRQELEAGKAVGLSIAAEAQGKESELQKRILQSIAANDVTIGFYGEPDGAGHGYGFDLSVPEYCTAVVNTNSYIENAIQAVKARPTYAEEDWLILISTDHGGQKNKNHYQASITERLIFIACNKDLTVANYLHVGYEL